MGPAADVDEYVAAAPAAAQPMLRQLRAIVHAAAPAAVERISYGMPTYDVSGRRLLHLSAARTHVAVYALVHVDGEIPVGLRPFVDHRSTLHFGFDQELPAAALTAVIAAKAAALGG